MWKKKSLAIEKNWIFVGIYGRIWSRRIKYRLAKHYLIGNQASWDDGKLLHISPIF